MTRDQLLESRKDCKPLLTKSSKRKWLEVEKYLDRVFEFKLKNQTKHNYYMDLMK